MEKVAEIINSPIKDQHHEDGENEDESENVFEEDKDESELAPRIEGESDSGNKRRLTIIFLEN